MLADGPTTQRHGFTVYLFWFVLLISFNGNVTVKAPHGRYRTSSQMFRHGVKREWKVYPTRAYAFSGKWAESTVLFLSHIVFIHQT